MDLSLSMNASAHIVILRVGGVEFETTSLTLHDGFLAALIKCDQSLNKYTIDRDPTHFRHILNFLRGAPSYPRDEQGVDELIAEADFYGLPLFVKHLQLQKTQLKERCVSHNIRLLGTKLQH